VILHDLATTCKISGDTQQAAARYRKATAYKGKRVPWDPEDLAVTMEAYTEALIECGDLAEARNILNQLRDLLPQVANSAQRAVHLHTLGRGFEVLGDEGQEDGYTEALNAYNSSLSLIDADADPGSYATVLDDLGDVYKVKGMLQEALTHYSRAVEYMRRLPDEKRRLASMIRQLGLIKLRIGNHNTSTHESTDGSSPFNITDSSEPTETQ
jgi:tetratricopeptide (TPR) repeat protein